MAASCGQTDTNCANQDEKGVGSIPLKRSRLADKDAKPNGCSAFSSALSLEDIRITAEGFANDRDWNQFHSPRNLVLALVGEVGELSECFQWKGEVQEGLPGWTESEKQHVGEELSDVLIYLIRLADKCGVDLPAAVMRKFEINGKKYPANMVSGSNNNNNNYHLPTTTTT